MEYKDINSKTRDVWNNYGNYILIGVISFASLCFLPFLGSSVGMEMLVPDTLAGWIVWIGSRLVIAMINILIFHNFILQARVNVRNDNYYLEANTIVQRQEIKKKEKPPRSPNQWRNQTYGRKGVFIFITSLLSVFALTQAILTFDWVSLLTYLFTVCMGVVFGWMSMKKAEYYWTVEYWQYAQLLKGEQQDDYSEQCRETESGRASSEEQG